MNKVELSKQISSKMSIKQVEALRFIHTLEEVFEEALLTDNRKSVKFKPGKQLLEALNK